MVARCNSPSRRQRRGLCSGPRQSNRCAAVIGCRRHNWSLACCQSCCGRRF